MMRLGQLLNTVRVISPYAEVRFISVPDREDIWGLRVVVGDVVLVETPAAPLEETLNQGLAKLSRVSQRMYALSQESV